MHSVVTFLTSFYSIILPNYNSGYPHYLCNVYVGTYRTAITCADTFYSDFQFSFLYPFLTNAFLEKVEIIET